MRRAQLLILTLGLPWFAACAPRTVPPAADNDPPSFDRSSDPAVKAESAGLSPEELSALLPPPVAPQPCGMPEGIYEPGWPRTLAPVSNEEPDPLPPGATTLAVLPDTQYYARCQNRHLQAQSEWIEHERKARNIKAVLTLGDLTDSNTDAEWQFFKQALAPLDPSLPIVLTPGNHDYGEGGTANRRQTLFAKYFEPAFARAAGALVETLDATTLENAFYSIDLGRAKLGVLSLEWSPRDKTVAWANDVLRRHPKHRAIVVTHAYLYSDDSRYDFAERGKDQAWNPRTYRTNSGDEAVQGAFDGEMLWQQLVKKHAGIFLVLSGHVLNDGTGQLTSQGDRGNTVHQILSNYQMLDEGGLGYLRLLELLPDGRGLHVKTYSPSLGLFATAADQDFSLTISPPLWGGAR